MSPATLTTSLFERLTRAYRDRSRRQQDKHGRRGDVGTSTSGSYDNNNPKIVNPTRAPEKTRACKRQPARVFDGRGGSRRHYHVARTYTGVRLAFHGVLLNTS